MLLSASFTAKFGLVFVLTLKSAFSRRFHFQANRKSIGSSKKTVLEIFKIALRLRDRHVFMWRSVKILSIFSIYFNFETNFLENENFFQKTGALFFSWTHEDWKASFPYETAISEANIKTNRMVTTKWAYHRERSFASNYFIFLQVLFQFKNLLYK